MDRTSAYARVKEWMDAGYIRSVAIHRTAREFGMSSAEFGRWLAEGKKTKASLKQAEEGQLTLF
jgi:hypothetical protein